MTPPSLSIRRQRAASRCGAVRVPLNRTDPLALLTTALLAVALITGPIFLGAARLWMELPLLTAVAFLLLIQGFRLMAIPRAKLHRIDAIDLVVVIFVLYVIARWWTSPVEYFSRMEMLEVVSYAGIFFTCRYGMGNRAHAMTLLYLLVILGLGETVFGYYLSNNLDWFPFGPMEKAQLQYTPRWLGTYESPNHYVSLLVMACSAALAIGSFSRLPWPLRIIFFYAALVMVVGVIFSGSRGGWISFLAALTGLVILGVRNGSMRWWVPIAGAVILLTAAAALLSQSPFVRHRLADARDMISHERLPTSLHIPLPLAALHIAHDHPFWGTGPGTFVFAHPRYLEANSAAEADLTHNDFLNCLDDYGLVGFGLVFVFAAAVSLNFFRPYGADNRWQDRVLVATGLAAWVALLLHSFIDFNLHVPANALLLFALTSLALGRLREARAIEWSTLSLTPLAPALGWAIILLSLLYGAQVTRSALSNRSYEQALANSDEVPISETMAKVENALYYDRGNVQALAYLGDLHRSKASLQKNTETKMAEAQAALDNYQKAFQASPLDDMLQARMGQTLDLMQRYPEGLTHFQLAVKEQSANWQFWYWLGLHYAQAGQKDEAEQAFNRSKRCTQNPDQQAEAEDQIRALQNPYSAPQSASLLPTPVPVSDPAPLVQAKPATEANAKP